MESAKWWRDVLQESLSQGDILANIPIAILSNPVQFLRKRTLKGNSSGWETLNSPGSGDVDVLAKAKIVSAIVISRSCELDKPKNARNARVAVAPIAPIRNLPMELQDLIFEQKVIACLPLPEIPTLGTYYADFRSITTLPRNIVNNVSRIASMTDKAIARLHAQIIAFFTHLVEDE